MNLIKKISLAALCVCGLCTTQPAHSAEPVLDSVKIDGVMRHFWIKIPQGLPANAPLVFVMHGYGNPGKPATWFDETQEKHQFAVCVPHGLKDPKGKPSWNVGYPSQKGWKIDDLSMACKLAKYVQKKYHLSKENTFLSGMSNGGEFCYLLAYSKQKTFKAVASLSGLTMEWIYRTMEAPRPFPIFEIHGTADHTSEWNGDLQNKGGWGAYLSTPEGVGYWIAKNRCEELTTDTVMGMDQTGSKKGLKIVRNKYSAQNTTGCDVWLYQVIGGKHSWFDKDINIGEEAWSFFQKYIK